MGCLDDARRTARLTRYRQLRHYSPDTRIFYPLREFKKTLVLWAFDTIAPFTVSVVVSFLWTRIDWELVFSGDMLGRSACWKWH